MIPALANHLLQSTIFALVAAVLTLCLRNNPSRLRYSVWLAASAKFLVPFSLFVAIGNRLTWSAAPVFATPRLVLVMDEIGQPFAVPEAHLTASVRVTSATSMVPILLLGMWIVGFAAVVIVWLVRWGRVAAVLRTGTVIREGREITELRRLDANTELISSPSQLEPGVFGILRPVLLLPDGIADHLEDAQLAAIFAHELCHVKRRDNLTAALHMFVEAVFWFHPLVWWIGAKLVDERERACDEEVVRLGGDPELYAAAILKICRFCLASPLVCAAGISGSHLGKRIENIMKGQALNRTRDIQKVAVASAGVLALITPIAVGVLGGGPASRARAQSPVAGILSQTARLTFEVASVKQNRSGSRDMSWGCRGTDGKKLSEVVNHSLRIVGYGDVPLGRCVVRNAPMNFIISFAYQIPWDQMNQMIAGGPEWFREGIGSPERFDIDAESGQPATRVQLYEMLQSLLAERFGLRLHQEYKEIPVYELTVAKSGSRLTSAPRDRDCSIVSESEVPCHNFSGGFDGLTGRSVSMDDLAVRLSRYAGAIVVDKTGLDGLFDIKTGGFYMPFPDVQDDQKTVPALSDMLQDQLGLKLKTGKNPVKVFVIDQVAKEPSAN
jgi:bla regulator protein blaR1